MTKVPLEDLLDVAPALLTGKVQVEGVDPVYHLAVLQEPYLGKILDGTKTIESRFSDDRRPPYRKVQVPDIVLLKRSAGPVVGAVQVGSTLCAPVQPGELAQFQRGICAPDEWWREAMKKAWVTLIWFARVWTFDPFEIEKRDQRAWVVLGPVRSPEQKRESAED